MTFQVILKEKYFEQMLPGKLIFKEKSSLHKFSLFVIALKSEQIDLVHSSPLLRVIGVHDVHSKIYVVFR